MISVAIWQSVIPVVIFMKGEIVSDEGGEVSFSVIGYKLRKCDLVRGSSVGWYLIDGAWNETPFQYINDPTPESTRATSYYKQHFGIWRWYGVPDDATSVRLTVQHNCGEHLTTTQAGVFVR